MSSDVGRSVLGIAGVVIGSAIAGPIGGAVGGILTSVLGNALFPVDVPNSVGPRLDDLTLQTSSEGAPVKFCLGPENRLSGNVIWVSDLIEVVNGGAGFVAESRNPLKGGGPGGGKSTTYTYFVNIAIGICEGEISNIQKIWAESKLLYDDGTIRNFNVHDNASTPSEDLVEDVRYDSLTIYKGTDTQTADPIIEAAEGVGDTPPFRNTAYVVIENLALADFGNRIPTFRFLVSADDGLQTGTAIGRIIERTRKLVAADYDVTECTDCLRGYTVEGPTQPAQMLEVIMTTFDIGVKESDGVLVFFPRDETDTKTVVEDDLAAHQMGKNVPRKMSYNDVPSHQVPSEVDVTFIQREFDYQKGNQKERRINHESEVVRTIQLPVTMASSEARAIAKRELWGAEIERRGADFDLPPSYMALEEGDRVTVPNSGETSVIRIEKLTRGFNSMLKIEGVVEDASTSTQVAATNSGSGNEDGPLAEPDTQVTLIIMDIPPLRDSDAFAPGYYFAMARGNVTETWFASSLFDSVDDSTFSGVGSTDVEAHIGTALTTLADGPYGFFDNANTVDVELVNGTLSSITELEVLNGDNVIMLGDEILAFQTATLLGGKQYRLSKLIRGIRDTEAFISTHIASEPFAILTGPAISIQDIPISSVGATRYWKGVGTYDTIGAVVSQNKTLTGERVKHFRPTGITGVRDGSNDLTISWLRRTRSVHKLLVATVPLPNLDQDENYVVEILDGGDNVLRTIEIADATSTIYTAAQQTADGLTPGDPVIVEIHQVSTLVGRSRTRKVTV